MNPGDLVRIISDPGRQGALSGNSRTVGSTLHWQVNFSDGRQWVPADLLEVVPLEETPIDLLRLGRLARPTDLDRALTHIRLRGRLANFIYSLETTDTDFYAYQFKPVVKLLQSAATGILVADEVGLGKTIEAGLVWTELRSRFDLRRLLVLCPAMLRNKWQLELKRRFGVRADILDAEGLLRRLKEDGSDEYAAVASLQGLRPPRAWQDRPEVDSARAQLARFLQDQASSDPIVDLLIIDEAHYLRNRDSLTFELGSLVRRVSQYAMLLSATPIHLKNDDLYSLLRVVEPDVFVSPYVFDLQLHANAHLVQAREATLGGATRDEIVERLMRAQRDVLLAGNSQIAALRQDLEGLQEVTRRDRVQIAARLETANLFGYAITRTRRREVHELTAVRAARALSVTMTPLEAELYQTVTETVRQFCVEHGQIEGFLLVMPQRQLASCMAAAIRSWQQDEPDALSAEELFDEVGIELDSIESPSQGPLMQALQQAVQGIAVLPDLIREDSKYLRLRAELLHFQEEYPGDKVVLFSTFRNTLRYLAERLRQDGITCAGPMIGSTDKASILEDFERPDGPTVLLSSEVGGEGIDLQFAWALVNYDLPWNPMRVEQRIGRLDRLGQRSPRVAIWNLIHENTIDDRIYNRLLLRLGIFERALGGLEAVIGERITELTRDLFTHRLSPAEEEARISQTALAIENRRNQEEALEAEAATLVAYGDYILEQVTAARDMSRRILSSDLKRYIFDFLRQRYPGSETVESPDDPDLAQVHLSAAAQQSLSEFARGARSATRLTSAATWAVPCRFENRLRAPRRADEEIVNQLHPLTRFAVQETEAQRGAPRLACAARLRRDLGPNTPPGLYRFLVVRWRFKALQESEQLWFGVEALDGALRLTEDDAERFVVALAEHGEDWETPASVDYGSVAAAVESGLLIDARTRYDSAVSTFTAQNGDRATAQLRSLDQHLRQQGEKLRALRQRHIAMGNAGLAKAQEGNLKRLEARIKREKARIEAGGRLEHSLDEICAGIAEVY